MMAPDAITRYPERSNTFETDMFETNMCKDKKHKAVIHNIKVSPPFKKGFKVYVPPGVYDRKGYNIQGGRYGPSIRQTTKYKNYISCMGKTGR